MAIPNPGVSAWFSLEYAAKVSPGQNVLVLGATGVTGAAAVQLARSSEILPRLFALAASGELQLDVERHALADVAAVWNGNEPSGTRVVLAP